MRARGRARSASTSAPARSSTSRCGASCRRPTCTTWRPASRSPRGDSEAAITPLPHAASHYRDQVLVVPIQEGITSYVSLVGIAQAWLLARRPPIARSACSTRRSRSNPTTRSRTSRSRSCGCEGGDARPRAQRADRLPRAATRTHRERANRPCSSCSGSVGPTPRARWAPTPCGCCRRVSLDREAAAVNDILAASRAADYPRRLEKTMTTTQTNPTAIPTRPPTLRLPRLLRRLPDDPDPDPRHARGRRSRRSSSSRSPSRTRRPSARASS